MHFCAVRASDVPQFWSAGGQQLPIGHRVRASSNQRKAWRLLDTSREPLGRPANPRPSGRCPSPKTRRPHKPNACRAYDFKLRGQDLNLRPSGYEQPQGTSQTVITSHNPSQSLQDGHEDLADSVQALPTLPRDFGPPVVRTPTAGPIGIGSLLTVKQVAARLGVSAATVYGLCERRELHHVRVANAIRVSPDAVEAFLRMMAAPPNRTR
jgi:excisionase family DNA binding protein